MGISDREGYGAWMATGILSHIFDPFYTTKEVGLGTGLGLSIVYGIMKDHGGLISAQSQPDEGASFELRLPTKELLNSVPQSLKSPLRFSAGFENPWLKRFRKRRAHTVPLISDHVDLDEPG